MSNKDKEVYDYRKDGVFDKEDRKKKRNRQKRIVLERVLVLAAFAVIIIMVVLIMNIIDSSKEKDKSADSGASSQAVTTTPTETSPTTTTTTAPATTTTTTTTVTVPPPLYPVVPDVQIIDGATYMDGILIVNKTYSIPKNYAAGVDDVAYAKLQDMYKAASEDGLTLWTASGHRTYEYQQGLYEKYAQRDGYAEADRYSSRPGHSEHETGLAFDVNDPSEDFHGTPEAKWLEEHCAEFGFIIRYPEGKEDITGFMYESWHVRYVGEELAKLIMENGICLEEYFDITSKYPDTQAEMQ